MKLGSLLLLACIQVLAQNSYQTFESDNFFGLKDANGTITIQPVYEKLGWTNNDNRPFNETIGVQKGQKWGLMSTSGKELVPAIYDKLEPFFGGYYKVAIQGKFTNRYFYGLINDKGKVMLNLDYFALDLEENLAIATKLEESQFLKGVLSKELKWVTPIAYSSIRLAEKLIIAQSPNGQYDIYAMDGRKLASSLDALDEKRSHLITNHRGKVGKISWDGAVIIPAVNKQITTEGTLIPFSNWLVDPIGENFRVMGDSLARWNLEWIVYKNEFFQLYSDGQSISEEYEYVASGQQHIIARSNGKSNWLALDISGQPILQNSDSIRTMGHYLVAKEKDQWWVHDRLGQKISDKKFEQVVAKNSRYLAVKKHDYWAILDGATKELSAFRYDEIGEIIGSKAVVKYIHQWGVHHPEHGWVLAPNFNKIDHRQGHFIAQKKDGYYLYDDSGFPLFQTIDQLIFTDEMILVFHEGNFSVIGKRGRPLSNTEYASISKWSDYFELQAEWSELIHENGRKVLEIRDMVQDVAGFSEGYFLIRKNNQYGFVDTDGKLRIANRYDSASVFTEGLAPIKLRGKWGFIDQNERLVIQPHYQEVSAFSSGIATYRLSNKYGFISTDGREITAAIFPSIERTTYGNYLLSDEMGRFGFADQKGILRLSPAYEAIEDLGDNRIRTTRNGKVGLLDYNGREILGFDYANIQISNGRLILQED